MRHIIESQVSANRLAELHMHSSFSPDAGRRGMSPEVLVELAERYTDLDVLSITDHDDISGSLRARDYAAAKGYRMEIIPGSEISTVDGHLVGLYLPENVPPGMPADETIRRVHRIGGLAIAPHPTYRRIGASSLGEKVLLGVAGHPDPEVYWDGFEVFSAGAQDLNRGFPNEEALRLYLSHPGKFGAALATTDGHGSMIGRAVTTFSGDLKQAIRRAETGSAVPGRKISDEYLAMLAATLGKKYESRTFEMRDIVLNHQRSRLRTGLKLVGVRADPNTEPETAFLSSEEKDRYNRLTGDRKLSWICSRLALKLAYCGVTGLETGFMPFLTVKNEILGGNSGNRSGPPYISANPDLHYSLSHSDLIGVAAVGAEPVGVDVELITPRRPQTLTGIALPGEIAAEDNELSTDELIARLWTLKEAAIKGTQIGISLKDLKIRLERTAPDDYRADVYFREAPHSSWREKIFKSGDWFISAAFQDTGFSQLQIEWHSLPGK